MFDTDRNGRDKNINNGVITGNGGYFDLRAALQAQRNENQRVRLFLSRVRPDFRCRDVVSHVRQVTGLTVRCEPIPTRYDTYRSYCIRASPKKIDRLKDENLWQRGVIVKEYTKFIRSIYLFICCLLIINTFELSLSNNKLTHKFNP